MYTANEGEEVELCAQIGRGTLGKDVSVALNISLGTGNFNYVSNDFNYWAKFQ